MKATILFTFLTLFSSVAHGQFVATTLAAQHHGGGGGSSFLVNYGQTIADTNNLDNGNNLVIFYTPFTTSSATVQTVTSLGIFVETPAAGNWGAAIYTDS